MNCHRQNVSSKQVSPGLLLITPSGPAFTAITSTGAATTTLASGAIPPGSPLVWPFVVLCLGSMAYDLGVRAVQRRLIHVPPQTSSESTTLSTSLDHTP